MTVVTENTSKKTTKVAVPHTIRQGIAIAGVLEQVAPEEPTQGRRIALVREQASDSANQLSQ